MLYMFLIAACLCSNYMAASEKQDQLKNKEYYDKLLDDQVKDPVEREKYNKGYMVMSFGIIPLSEVQVLMGDEGCFGSLPYHQAVEIKKALDANKKQKEDDIKLALNQ